MAEITPLLDRELLQETFTKRTIPEQPVLPNVPFVAPATPLPMVDGKPTPSALSAIENSILSTPLDGKITGGSIPRSLFESTNPRYNIFVPGDYNNEDAYAQGQGWPSKMINGTGKGLLLTGTTFLQTTLGTVNGLARMLETGRAASFYDNDLNRWLDDVNKAAEDVLPNYYTDVERNANWYSPNKLFTGNFLWDGIVKNLGFAAGAAFSGALFATALRALPLTSRLFSVGKAAETLAATEEALLSAGKAADTYGKVKSLSDKFLGNYQLMNPVGRGLVAALSTSGEAGFEAFHNINHFRDQKIQEWKDSHLGEEPRGADLEAINAEADNVGNSSFLLNTALLSATNYIQFPKILGSSYSAEKGLINSLKSDISAITKTATGEFVEKQASSRFGKLLNAANKVRPYTFSTTEGFEEGAQFAISVGTEHYYDKKYDGDVANFLESMVQGFTKTFGTNEGMENVLIGGLSGALMTSRGRFQNWKFSSFTKDTIDSVNRATILQEERERALRQGDILESKDLEADYIINYLTPRIKYGRYDLVASDIVEYKKLASTEEGFAQIQAEGKALPGDTREAFLRRLANLESTANNIKSLYQSLTLRYGGLYKDGEQVFSQPVMDKMIYAATKVADYDNRLSALSTSLIEKQILVPELITEDKINEEVVDNTLKTINKLNVNSDVKDDIKLQLQDYLELSLRRDKFIKEYDSIKSSPEKYKEKDTTLVVPEVTTVKVKQTVVEDDKKKTVTKPLEVGREYSLTDVVRREGNTIQLSPKLTILSSTLGGEFEVKLPSGETTFLTAKQFQDFNIADTPNSFPQLKSVVDTVIDEVLDRKKYKDIVKPVGDKLAYINSLDNKALINDVLRELEEKQEEFKKQQEEALKLAKNKVLKQELLSTEDKGVQTVVSDDDFEVSAKKTDIGVLTSTKPATSSDLPHHIRSNTFGANLSSFKNRDKIRGVLVTSKNEDKVLPGLTKFLKGTSDVDASKIIALVMVQDGKPVGVDGKILTKPSVNNAIFQVMPDPKLEWSKDFGGGTMFRKGTTSDQIEYYKKQYETWVNETLINPALVYHEISASMGIPEYVTYLDDKGNSQRDFRARTSVEEAGLITKTALKEKPLVFIPTLDSNIQKGSTVFNTPLGRPFLNLPNGFVKLDNRKLTKKEVNTIYNAIYQLAVDVDKNGNAKSENSRRLIKWLRSIVYWGAPKNEISPNTVFFKDTQTEFNLIVSNKGNSYPFTPTSIEQNKEEIISLLSGMYNNINSGLTDKPELWNEQYEEITEIGPKGGIVSTFWQNYQTYLLSKEGRKAEDIPLTTQMKPIVGEETNRKGIYFSIMDTVDNFTVSQPKGKITPEKPVIKTGERLEINLKELNFIPDSDLLKLKNPKKSKTTQSRIMKEVDQLNAILKCLTGK